MLPCDAGIITPTGYHKRLSLKEDKKCEQTPTIIKI